MSKRTHPLRPRWSLLSIFVASLLHCAVAQAAPSAEDTERAKKNAASIAGTVSKIQFNIDSSKGTGVIGQTNTRDSMNKSLGQFQALTGVSGVTQVSNHTTSGGMASVMTTNVDAFVDYQCGAGNKKTTAGGLYLNILGCEGETLKLEVCGKTAEAGLCSAATDYSSVPALRRGQFSDWNGLKLGLACNSSQLCRISVKGSYTLGGNDAQLKAQSNALTTKAGTLNKDFSKAVTDGHYAEKMVEYGVPFKECSDRNQGSLEKGVAINCGDRDESINFKGDKTGAACKPERRCIRTEKKPISVSRTCTRSFELTERITQYQYNNYASCSVKQIIDPKTGESKLDDSCYKDGNDMRAGKSRVGEIPQACTKTGKRVDADGKPTGNEICLEFSHTEYWLSLATGTVLTQVDRPTPVVGACAPVTGTLETTCPSNNWFGRTLSAAACTATILDENGEPRTMQLDNISRPGCGMCLTPTISQACYGAPHPGEGPENCDAYAKRDTCVMTGVEPLTTTDEIGGLVTSQLETYQCQEGASVCVEWETVTDKCYNDDMAVGLDKLTYSHDGYAAFANALVAAGTLDAVGSGVDSSANSNAAIPKIFNGDNDSCNRPVGGLVGNLLSRNCCSKDLMRPKKGQLIREGCDIGDAELAAARRSNYTKYIGEYCSKKSFWGQCLRKTESYCTFPGILPRIIHEQGREQLLQMATSDNSGQMRSGNMSFKYYDTGRGSWSPETVVNGNRVRAWQWPNVCKDPGASGEALLNGPNAPACPGMVMTWFATCTSGACDNLTESPEHGTLTWDLMNVNPLEAQSAALNRFTIAKGGCTADNNCRYEIKAWPLGVGGKVVVSKNITWALFSEEQQISSQNVDGASVYRLSNVGDFMFKGYSTRGAGTLPATVRMDFSSDGGQTWMSYQLPTNSPNQEMNLGGSGATVIGSCDLVTNTCGFSMTGTTTITAKPWGTPRSPDCSGFTAGQLAALDFGKMDLSEWLDTVIDKATEGVNQESLVKEATAQFTAYNSIYNGGEVTQTQSATSSANFARIVPSEGFGPFSVRMAVSGIWPEITGNSAVDTNVVSRVTVDWGDCSPVEELQRLTSDNGNGFRASHTYQGPDTHACLGSPEKNVTHEVKLTAYTSKSGVQKRSLFVENAWAEFPGGKHNNAYETPKTSADPSQGAPASPSQGILGKR